MFECGRGMTCVLNTSPTLRPAAAPASTAAFTAPTSPRTIAVTRPASIFSQPTKVTLADLTAASAASIIATRPRHSINPRASRSMVVSLFRCDYRLSLLQGGSVQEQPTALVFGAYAIRLFTLFIVRRAYEDLTPRFLFFPRGCIKTSIVNV